MKEIENDSIFCPICGEKIDEIDLTPEEEVKEEVVTKEEEKVKEPKSKVKVKEKARKLYKYIFILIISIIAFVLPFANLTGYDVFMGSNLITFFVSNSLREYIKSLNEQVCLYEFRIYRKGIKDVIGWLIERKNGQITIEVNNYNMGHYLKRYKALEFCKSIIEERGI